ncbi:hypothetical protein ACOSQ2_003147 [Xanthoceras sorbifolium]
MPKDSHAFLGWTNQCKIARIPGMSNRVGVATIVTPRPSEANRKVDRLYLLTELTVCLGLRVRKTYFHPNPNPLLSLPLV